MSDGQTHSVTRHLDVDAEGYDVQIRRLIPYYDEMLATGVELLAALAPASGHILDLGGGTGALSAAVLDGLPRVRVTVLDVDRDMLGEARRRLTGYERVAFQEGSFLDPLPSADAVVFLVKRWRPATWREARNSPTRRPLDRPHWTISSNGMSPRSPAIRTRRSASSQVTVPRTRGCPLN